MKKRYKAIFGIFMSILIVLITINVYLYLYNENYSLSFTDLFRTFADSPRIDSSFIKLKFQSGITDDWDVFNFLRDFINGLWQIIGVVLYVCVQIANSMIYIFKLLQQLFIGVLG